MAPTMLISLDGIAGSGKSTVRDRLLEVTEEKGIPATHLGQFSWLSLPATRTLVALRSGKTLVDASAALAAVRKDLVLHVRHNLCHAQGLVIADRWLLSSAALIALLYDQPVETFVADLTGIPEAQPLMGIVLTASPALCSERLARRPSSARFLEAPDTAEKFAVLINTAAEFWAELTHHPVLFRASAQPSNVDELVDLVFEFRETR